MKQLLIVLILTTVLISCKKSASSDSYYTITGIVTDYNSKVPIAGAKVYASGMCIGACPLGDSAITDASGKVSFKFKKDGVPRSLFATKSNYILLYIQFYTTNLPGVDRIDTVYLGRPSNVNVTVHKTGVYLPLDSIAIKVSGDYYSANGYSSVYRNLIRDKTDAPDKLLNLYTFYNTPNSVKLYFQWDIIRGGAIISTKTDSTDLIQFGTKSYNLNY